MRVWLLRWLAAVFEAVYDAYAGSATAVGELFGLH
jgi:hypothetical protein